ncbi:unnamed protein product [Phytophthora lilii]|uniref:Unnamed protein product n=1 Tax=Phytophthora lilii TaxID=2077276 RepID=A0A9W6TTA5_9STRA|nr:unnamed protein product [Phytophthora lilii]
MNGSIDTNKKKNDVGGIPSGLGKYTIKATMRSHVENHEIIDAPKPAPTARTAYGQMTITAPISPNNSLRSSMGCIFSMKSQLINEKLELNCFFQRFRKKSQTATAKKNSTPP